MIDALPFNNANQLQQPALPAPPNRIQVPTFGGYDVPPMPPLMQVVRFNDQLIVIFTCQTCGVQYKNEFPFREKDKKDIMDALDEWITSITDSFPHCTGKLCGVLKEIAK